MWRSDLAQPAALRPRRSPRKPWHGRTGSGLTRGSADDVADELETDAAEPDSDDQAEEPSAEPGPDPAARVRASVPVTSYTERGRIAAGAAQSGELAGATWDWFVNTTCWDWYANSNDDPGESGDVDE